MVNFCTSFIAYCLITIVKMPFGMNSAEASKTVKKNTC